jgi:hypothetical protein
MLFRHVKASMRGFRSGKGLRIRAGQVPPAGGKKRYPMYRSDLPGRRRIGVGGSRPSSRAVRQRQASLAREADFSRSDCPSRSSLAKVRLLPRAARFGRLRSPGSRAVGSEGGGSSGSGARGRRGPFRFVWRYGASASSAGSPSGGRQRLMRNGQSAPTREQSLPRVCSRVMGGAERGAAFDVQKGAYGS